MKFQGVTLFGYPALIILSVFIGFNLIYAQGYDCPCRTHAIAKCSQMGKTLDDRCYDKWDRECLNAREVADKMYGEFCRQGNPKSKECERAKWLQKDINRQTSCFRIGE